MDVGLLLRAPPETPRRSATRAEHVEGRQARREERAPRGPSAPGAPEMGLERRARIASFERAGEGGTPAMARVATRTSRR